MWNIFYSLQKTSFFLLLHISSVQFNVKVVTENKSANNSANTCVITAPMQAHIKKFNLQYNTSRCESCHRVQPFDPRWASVQTKQTRSIGFEYLAQ